MNFKELRKLQKEYHFQLNEKHSDTAKKLLQIETVHQIVSNIQRQRAFKKFSNMYRKYKQTKFVADLSKGRDTQAKFSHVYWVLLKAIEILEDLQNAPEDRKSVEFTKDERLKVLSGAIKELQKLEKLLRRNIKSSELVQI